MSGTSFLSNLLYYINIFRQDDIINFFWKRSTVMQTMSCWNLSLSWRSVFKIKNSLISSDVTKTQPFLLSVSWRRAPSSDDVKHFSCSENKSLTEEGTSLLLYAITQTFGTFIKKRAFEQSYLKQVKLQFTKPNTNYEYWKMLMRTKWNKNKRLTPNMTLGLYVELIPHTALY